MFKRDSQNSLYYEGKNGIEYSLLEGITDSNKTSDIVFIFREPTKEDLKNDYYGEVVAWVYGGFEELEFVEDKIKEYEEKLEK